MSEDWKETIIGQCLDASFSGEWGVEPKPANALVFRATDIDDEGRIVGRGAERRLPIGKLTAKRLQDGDILLEGSGGGPGKPVGRVAYFEGGICQGSAVCSNFFKTLRPNRSEVDPRFLLRKLAWFYKQPTLLTLQQQTTGIINLKFEEYLSAPIEIPKTINEQQKLAQVLDTLDTAIHQTEAIIAKLKAVKLGLLHDLLTRGIDANGELRPPQVEAPHLYKESSLGWIPKEWGLKPLGHILAEPTKNGLYKPSQFHGRGPLMVQMGGLFAGDAATFETATRVQVTPFEFNTFGLVEGDLLFARRSLVFEGAGQCVIVRNLTEPATFESSIVRVRVRQNEAHPEFVCQFLRGHRSNAQRRTLIRQVAVSGVSGADIRELLIALPSLEEQGLVISRQLEMQARIDLELESVAKLRSQKAGLMDDLLTGCVRVTPLLAEAAQQGGA